MLETIAVIAVGYWLLIQLFNYGKGKKWLDKKAMDKVRRQLHEQELARRNRK